MKLSWVTTVGGSMAAAGAALQGAADLAWMTPAEYHNAKMLGVVLLVAGLGILGAGARDHNKSDQDAGLRPELPPPGPQKTPSDQKPV